MAKTLSVYLNDAELELLGHMQKALNVEEESRVLKLALRQLQQNHNGHDHNGKPFLTFSDATQLRGMVERVFEEVDAEAEQKRKEAAILAAMKEAQAKQEAKAKAERETFVKAMMESLKR